MEEQNGLLNELEQFTGTERYHKITLGNVKATDGIVYLCENAKCYWLMDIVSSYQNKLKKKGVKFQLWTIKKTEGNEAVVNCKEDSNQPAIVRQVIPYTDFPLDKFEFYCMDGIILLKSEY